MNTHAAIASRGTFAPRARAPRSFGLGTHTWLLLMLSSAACAPSAAQNPSRDASLTENDDPSLTRDGALPVLPPDAGLPATDPRDGSLSDAQRPPTSDAASEAPDAQPQEPWPAASNDWMHGRYGVGFHYLKDWLAETKDGDSQTWNATVDSFDVERFADDAQASA